MGYKDNWIINFDFDWISLDCKRKMNVRKIEATCVRTFLEVFHPALERAS